MTGEVARVPADPRPHLPGLVLLTALTMIAFAANSVLNRMALAGGHSDAVSFAVLRLGSGAVVLGALSLALRGRLRLGGERRVAGVLWLLVYVFGFSVAYVELDAGLGALILFGVVQITMFAGGIIAGERMPARRWFGAGLAFAGLSWLLWPGGTSAASPAHGLLMGAAGMGWGLYSLAGRGADDPLQVTAANFVLATPAGLALALVVYVAGAQSPAGGGLLAPGGRGIGAMGMHIDTAGVVLACLSGAVTSGLGYALWYAVLPRLTASVAAVAQLTVPVISLTGGMLLLDEAPTPTLALASALVLGGVALAVVPWRGRTRRTADPAAPAAPGPRAGYQSRGQSRPERRR